ncbi:PREDICTED: uncharacterized protein LOC109582145 [Amphimedon queenslandica]|uniref:Uncharacterized protein n=1 Tax=Amphimedon queenslandica TaxID=400682 RepID=A0AAN0J5N4_AMPQE|nr:PREDICTED: uncharacterized protein LOC109582145 [Amphimedon queenslandica]|eukprot:XP_019852325.1 PREDICTED: uncharacterized protein LOC109582145 [Amphimedon queenslandica]
MNITGSVPVPLHQQCTITVVFSNEAGSSEPFILAFDTTLPISNTPSPTNTPLVTSTPGITSPNSTVIIIPVVISLTIVIIIIIITAVCVTVLVFAVYKRNRNRATSSQHISTVPNAAYEDINKFNKLNINVNPAYGEVRGTTTEQQQHVTYEEVNF